MLRPVWWSWPGIVREAWHWEKVACPAERTDSCAPRAELDLSHPRLTEAAGEVPAEYESEGEEQPEPTALPGCVDRAQPQLPHLNHPFASLSATGPKQAGIWRKSDRPAGSQT
jgi:hypothetical protein